MDETVTNGSRSVSPNATSPRSVSDAGRELAVRLSELARQLESENGLQPTLDAIVAAAVKSIPGAEHASILSVRRRKHLETLAASSELARAVDQAQYDTGQGPCLETLYHHLTVRLDDVTTDRRWPVFGERARDLGVGSMLALQLFVEGDDPGVLNLGCERTGAFDGESEQVGLMFASHASIAMAGARRLEEMRSAVSSRDVIGQAKGMLMERYGFDEAMAFKLLARTSQDTNRKLLEIAEQLVSSGELAGVDRAAPEGPASQQER